MSHFTTETLRAAIVDVLRDHDLEIRGLGPLTDKLLDAISKMPATTTVKVTGGLWDQLTVLSGYYITQPPTPDHEFVQVCNGDLRKMVELMNTSVQAPAPQMTGRWRMFEEATGPGYWGIELEDAGNDDDAILYPIKAHRDTIARIVEAHNAALATSEGRSELADKYDTGTTS